MSYKSDLAIAGEAFKQYRKANYSKHSEDDAFERFASMLATKRFRLDTPEIESGIVGGKLDGGIDSVYFVINSTENVDEHSARLTRRKTAMAGLQTGMTLDLVVVQAKKEQSWDTNVFPKLESSLKEMLAHDVSESKLRDFPLSDPVIDLAMRLKKLRSNTASLVPRVSATVLYISLADDSKIDSYMKTKAKQLESSLAAVLPSSAIVSAQYVGAAGVGRLIRESTDFEASLKFLKAPVRDGAGLVGLARLDDFLKFISVRGTGAIREDMFALNVRDFAGGGVAVNRAISDTLSKDSATEFWWMNNGVTVVADRAIDPLENVWQLTNPMVVNGLQTSHVLHSQMASGAVTKKRLKQSVLVRIITVADPVVREAVIVGTNNQSPVSSIQLHANDERQVVLEAFLRARGWYYERRRHQYRGAGVPAARVRSTRELAQAVMSLRLVQPDTARARPAQLLSTSTGWASVFGPAVSDELFATALDGLEVVDSYLRSDSAKEIGDSSINVRFYLLAGAALRASGVSSVEVFRGLPDHALSIAFSDSLLEELHVALVEEADLLDDGEKSRDRIYKGSALLPEFIARALTS